jgi:transmembrane sensor
MIEDRNTPIDAMAAEWLARSVGDAWSTADQAELDAWLDASTAHRVAFLRLEAAWAETARLKALAAGRVAGEIPARGEWSVAATPRTAAALNPDRAVPPQQALRRGLAVGVLMACSALAIWAWTLRESVERISYAAQAFSMREVQLADTSRATLSSGGRIAVEMSRAERRIDLERGEAFFSAASQPQRPFIVTAGNRRVVAVGTKFSVRRDGEDLRVVVIEGLVRLEAVPVRGAPASPVTLLPAGSIANATVGGVLVRSGSLAEAERALNWRSGFLEFDATPLSQVAAEFSRYSGRRLVTGDATAAAVPIGGNFRWSNVDGFVRLLEQGFGIRAERRGDTIVLLSAR